MKSLQKILTATLMVLLITSCGAAYNETKGQRSAQEAIEQAVNVKALENANFILEVTQIIPVGFPSKSSLGEYELRLDGNIVTTRLPFIGVAKELQFGNNDEDISIVFDKEEVDLSKDFSKASKGEYHYKFKGGKGKRPWTVHLTVFDNATGSIDCFCEDGRAMHYFANMRIPKKK